MTMRPLASAASPSREEELARFEELADLLDALDEAVGHDVAGADAGGQGASGHLLGGGAVTGDDRLGCFFVDVGHALDSSQRLSTATPHS
jgi:hypothetical protein